METVKNNCSLKNHMKAMLDICAQKRSFYIRAYDMYGQNSLSGAVFKAAVEYYTDYIIQKTGKEDIDDELEMAIRFNCYGDICFVRDWIKKEIRCSSEELAEMMVSNMPERIKKYFD